MGCDPDRMIGALVSGDTQGGGDLVCCSYLGYHWNPVVPRVGLIASGAPIPGPPEVLSVSNDGCAVGEVHCIAGPVVSDRVSLEDATGVALLVKHQIPVTQLAHRRQAAGGGNERVQRERLPHPRTCRQNEHVRVLEAPGAPVE